MTKAVNVASVGSPGVSLGFKNRIINGALNIWQRGTSVTPSLGSLSSYVSDRWASYQTGAATAVTKQNGFNGQPNCAAFNGVASNTEVTMFQCIESNNCADLVGQNITFSVWLYSTVASKSVSLYIDTANTVDTFNATTQKATVTVSVPAGWAQYTLTYSNADSSVANGIRVRMNFGACTSGTYAFTGAQLEVGTTATNFEVRDYGRELSMCQRYYNQFLGGARINIGTCSNGWGFYYSNVTMRTSPTVTFGGNWRFLPGGGGATTPAASETYPYGFNWYTNAAAYGIVQGTDAGPTSLTISAEL